MLIGVELISELVHTVLATGRITGQQSLSLLLIAAPEEGKTSIVMNAAGATAVQLTDVTSQGVYNVLRMPEITHMILSDLTSVTAHKASVSKLTYAALNAATEEGVHKVAVGPLVEDFSGRGVRGVIACLTLDLARDGRAWWNKTGFTSRFIPFCYEHSTGLEVKIKDSIIATLGTKRQRKQGRQMKFSLAKVRVAVPRALADRIRVLADAKTKQLKNDVPGKGYRRLKQYLGLCQGHALIQKRRIVTQTDLNFLEHLQPYINYSRPWPI